MSNKKTDNQLQGGEVEPRVLQNGSLGLLWMNLKGELLKFVGSDVDRRVFLEPPMVGEDKFVIVTPGILKVGFGGMVGEIWKDEEGVWNGYINHKLFKEVLEVEAEIVTSR